MSQSPPLGRGDYVEVVGIIDEHTGPFWWERAVTRSGVIRSGELEIVDRDPLTGWGTVTVRGTLTDTADRFSERLFLRLGIVKWIRSLIIRRGETVDRPAVRDFP